MLAKRRAEQRLELNHERGLISRLEAQVSNELEHPNHMGDRFRDLVELVDFHTDEKPSADEEHQAVRAAWLAADAYRQHLTRLLGYESSLEFEHERVREAYVQTQRIQDDSH